MITTILVSIDPEDHMEVRLVGRSIQLAIGGVGGPTLMLDDAKAAENLARHALAAYRALAANDCAVQDLAPAGGELGPPGPAAEPQAILPPDDIPF